MIIEDDHHPDRSCVCNDVCNDVMITVRARRAQQRATEGDPALHRRALRRGTISLQCLCVYYYYYYYYIIMGVHTFRVDSRHGLRWDSGVPLHCLISCLWCIRCIGGSTKSYLAADRIYTTMRLADCLLSLSVPSVCANCHCKWLPHTLHPHSHCSLLPLPIIGGRGQ
jgi:hypothetical protein